jgi:putative nucleotidyltransferase with HDIG domain
MEALAEKLGGDPESWYIAGLLHDADYEKTKENTKEHTKMVLTWLEQHGVQQDVKDAILAHGWGYVEGNPEPATPMQWALYCCDELTGFIVAVTLIRPTKILADVSVENVLSKWSKKDFAAGVHRRQIELCQEKLGIPVAEFVTIALTAMQEKREELGL